MAGQPITRQRERHARKNGGNAQLQPNQTPPEAAQDTNSTQDIPEYRLIPQARETITARVANYVPGQGRHTEYTPAIASIIIDRLIDGESLRGMCEDPAFPLSRPSTVIKWLTQQDDFALQYTRAREEQAETLADDILHIADTCEDPRIAAVRIDARKWIASKLKPKKYGDIRQLDVSGGIDLNVAALNKQLPGRHKQAGPDRQIDVIKGV